MWIAFVRMQRHSSPHNSVSAMHFTADGVLQRIEHRVLFHDTSKLTATKRKSSFLPHLQPWQLFDSQLKPVNRAKVAEAHSFLYAMSALPLYLIMGSNDHHGHCRNSNCNTENILA